MKTVLVNDRAFTHRLTGVGRYLAAVIAHWPGQPNVRLVGPSFRHPLTGVGRGDSGVDPAAFAEPAPIELRSLRSLVVPRPTWRKRLVDGARPAFEFAYGLWLRQAFVRYGCNGYFEPNNLPFFAAQPCVTAIHDLSAVDLPHLHPAERVAAWQRRLERCQRWTTHFVCFSRATARRLKQVFGAPDSATTVIPHASWWRAPPKSGSPISVRARLRLPVRYLLHLGTIEPRKNLYCLLDAYARKSPAWRRQTPLILAGMPGWGDEAFWRGLREHPMADHAFTTGYLTDTQARTLLLGASALVLPSFYEGFGLPALEAMALGVPVIASNTTSLPEVCGNAGVLLAPEDIDAWAEWIERGSEPGSEKDERVAAGRRRASEFSWERTAKAYHDLLDQLCEATPARAFLRRAG